MLRLSSDGDICASVSHEGAPAPTFPIAVGNPLLPLLLSLSLFQSLHLSISLSLPPPPLDSTRSPRSAGEGSHRDEIEAGSCSSSPRVII